MSRAVATDEHNVHSQEGKHETILVRGRRLNIIGRLGEGAYAVVFLVQDPNTLRRYALKRLAVRREEDLPKLIEEMERTERLSNHPFICACYAYEVARVEGINYASMLLQHGGTPLVNLMQEKLRNNSNPTPHFQQSDIIRLAMQIGSAVSFMHHQDPPIAHRDIKAENIMESRGVFRLVDFGSASTQAYEPRASNEYLRVQSEVASQTTLVYRAPEMCDVYRKHRIDQQVDVWAVGVLLYYVMYFQFPFEETNLAILNGQLKLPPQTPSTTNIDGQMGTTRTFMNYESDLLECVRTCLTQNPAERWTIDQMLEFLSEKFPEEAILVKETMDSMDDDENPNLIKSNWLNADNHSNRSSKFGEGGGLSHKMLSERRELGVDEQQKYSSLICPGEMSRQELAPFCVAILNDEQKDSSNSNSNSQIVESEVTTRKPAGGGGLFGKLKWNQQQGGGSSTTSSSTTSTSQQQNLPRVESGGAFLNNNNKQSSSSSGSTSTSGGTFDLFASGGKASSSSGATQQSSSASQATDLFGLPVNNNNTDSKPTTSSLPPKKKDPFANMF